MADLQPTCEDYHSDDSDGPVSFQGRSSPNAANVSTKRSHPSDLDKEKPPAQERAHPNCDLRSDSGYSSYTAATSSSTNSAQSAPLQSSPSHVAAQPTAAPSHPAAPSPPPPAAPKTRRPAQSNPRQTGSNTTTTPTTTTTTTTTSSTGSSRPRALSRSASQSTKPTAEKRRPTITQEHRPDRKDRRDSRLEESSAPPLRRRPTVTRPDLLPSQSAKEVNRLSVNTQDTRSLRSDPAYPSPPSPNQARHQTQYYKQGQVVVQPAARPRKTSNARPMSYSGEGGPQYWVGASNPYPSPPQEPHGPPLSHSAYQNMGYGMPPMGPPPHVAAYNGYPLPYAYDAQERPGITSRHSNNMARNGPKPVITQVPREQQYSARRHQAQSASATQTRFPTPLQIGVEAYQSDSASESEYTDDDYYEPEPTPNDPRYGRAIMPPPPAHKPTKSKSKKEKFQRPPMRHANTTQVADVDRSRRQSIVVQDAGRQRTAHVADRRASVSRPAPLQRQMQPEYPARGGAQVVVNRSEKSERRRSAQVYDTTYNYEAYREEREKADRKAAKEEKARLREEKAMKKAAEAAYAAQYEAEQEQRKRSNRNSRVLYDAPGAFYSGSDDDDDDDQDSEGEFIPEAPAPPPVRTRRGTDAGKGKGRVGEHKTKRIESAAEEYISAQRGTHNPLNDHIHNAAKRASRVPSMPSHSGSSGSEKHSQSNRTAVANANNEIRLRVDANAPLSLQFNGDMEGRTLRMIPAENGMADLVISGGRGESQYHGSDRGSNSGDRMALVQQNPRRLAEELIETSGRSHRRRESRTVRDHGDRDVIQRPLRRRAHTTTYAA